MRDTHTALSTSFAKLTFPFLAAIKQTTHPYCTCTKQGMSIACVEDRHHKER